jgi:hypothetical protein
VILTPRRARGGVRIQERNGSGEASASWGYASASVQGGVSGGLNAAREELSKNITNATSKHVSKASAKRQTQVETSYEVKEQAGEETAIERELENINLSRTLNFVFRQLNQQFISLLHLVDVRVAYARLDIDDAGNRHLTYEEATLAQLESLLAEHLVADARSSVRDDIVTALKNVLDYQDQRHEVIEDAGQEDASGKPVPNTTYLRWRRQKASVYTDPFSKQQFEVPGVIVDATSHVLRTDGVIAEAILGQSDALDGYSTRLQTEAARTERLTNDIALAELERRRLGLEIVKSGAADQAKLYEQIYEGPPPAQPPVAPAVTNGQPE